MPTIKDFIQKTFNDKLDELKEETEKPKPKTKYRPPLPKLPVEDEEEKASQWSKKSQSPRSNYPSTEPSTDPETAHEIVKKARTALDKIMKGDYDDSLEGIPMHAYHDALESLGITDLKRVGETIARWLNERPPKMTQEFFELLQSLSIDQLIKRTSPKTTPSTTSPTPSATRPNSTPPQKS